MIPTFINLYKNDYDQIFMLPKEFSLDTLPSLMFTKSFIDRCLKPESAG